MGIACLIIIVFMLLTIISSSSSSSSITKPAHVSACWDSIVSFGDSLSDTGNWALICPISLKPGLPYGQTFFHHPAGRACDGRIILDFIAESLGLPFVQPSFGGENAEVDLRSFTNFAISGATALDPGFFKKIGIHIAGTNNANLEKLGFKYPVTNLSLGAQLDWFKQFLAELPDGRQFLESSFVVMGEIGGDDYNIPLMQGIKREVVQSFAPSVVNYIGSTIEELIKLGVETLLVPGVPPMGCLPVFLTQYQTFSEKDYDPKTGCLRWINKISKHHNKLLQKELSRIQNLHPNVTIIYADYYNAALRVYLYPNDFGFIRGNLKACCGGGGPYNFNMSAMCGRLPATSCDDPSSFTSWDGLHFTEATNRVIAQGLLEGPYTTPQIKTVCLSHIQAS